MRYHVPEKLHADLSLPATQHGNALPWVPSPLKGVERRFLERDGAEIARATSFVRYAPNSRFSAHVHALGEEFLVLSGVFSDERGDYAEGCYLRNPPGSSHAPHTAEGCEIFVKLRQMPLGERHHLLVQTHDLTLAPTGAAGVSQARLFESDSGECVAIESLAAHCQWKNRAAHHGEEILVLEGTLGCNERSYGAHSWLRFPAGKSADLATQAGCRYWVKRGHL